MLQHTHQAQSSDLCKSKGLDLKHAAPQQTISEPESSFPRHATYQKHQDTPMGPMILACFCVSDAAHNESLHTAHSNFTVMHEKNSWGLRENTLAGSQHLLKCFWPGI
jgi:hypothetical protein